MNDKNMFHLMRIVFEDVELTRSQRDKIANFLGVCEDTGKTCIPEAHRVKRGNKGGRYVLNNIKWVCNEKHKEFHCKEEGMKA